MLVLTPKMLPPILRGPPPPITRFFRGFFFHPKNRVKWGEYCTLQLHLQGGGQPFYPQLNPTFRKVRGRLGDISWV